MDFRLALFCIIMVGGAVGMAVPGGPLDQQAALAAQASGAVPHVEMARSNPAEWGEGVVLHREGDGHFYADVQVDGGTLRMLVDTGASVVALTPEDAATMGLDWSEDDVEQVAQGASGPVYGVNTQIDRMGVGGNEATNVRAIIITQGAGISLLGQSYLSTLGQVRIAGDNMILGG
jgi:aspartyl protease family protein